MLRRVHGAPGRPRGRAGSSRGWASVHPASRPRRREAARGDGRQPTVGGGSVSPALSTATNAESFFGRFSVNRLARTCSSRQPMAWIANASSGRPTTCATCSVPNSGLASVDRFAVVGVGFTSRARVRARERAVNAPSGQALAGPAAESSSRGRGQPAPELVLNRH